MLQIKTKRKQEKIFRRIKTVSILASVLVLLAIADLVYNNYLKEKVLFLSPISDKASVGIEESLKKNKISYKNLNEAPSYYVLELTTGETVIISKNKNIGEQLSSLQLIRSRLKIEGRDFKSLDLRFSQPVIK